MGRYRPGHPTPFALELIATTRRRSMPALQALLQKAQKPIERAQVYLQMALLTAITNRDHQVARSYLAQSRQNAIDEYDFLVWFKFYEETVEEALSDPSFESRILS